MCEELHIEARGLPWVLFLRHFLPIFLRKRLLPALSLPNSLVGQKTLGIPVFMYSFAEITSLCHKAGLYLICVLGYMFMSPCSQVKHFID